MTAELRSLQGTVLAAISRADLHVPRWGVPMAPLTFVDTGLPLVVGSRCVLALGDLAMVGTLRPGGDFGGTATYTWVGGGGGWDTQVPARSYSDPDGVKLNAVAKDLAVAVAEVEINGAIFPPIVTDRSLGPTWARPAGLARDALDALSPHATTAPNLGGQWWVGVDGVTRIGPREATSCKPSTLSILGEFDVAALHGTVALEDDAIAQLMPGATVTIDGLPAPLTVGSCVVHATDGALTVELFGERSAAELLADLVAALTAYTRWHARYPFQVSSVVAGGVNVDPLNALAAALPGLPALPQWFGVPGVTATLVEGAPVAVEFLGGSPGGAVIAGYGPGVNPSALGLAASGNIDAVAPLVNLGAAGGQFVVVDGHGTFAAWVAAVSAATGVSAPAGFVATKVRAF